VARRVGPLLVLALLGASATAQAQVVNGCQPTQYLDRTAASADREITWEFGVEQDPERCMQVKRGQTVVWNTHDFVLHPLGGLGGDVPNPINSHQNGSVTFTTPGTFGFVCENHTVMRGAIKVVQGPPPAVPALLPSLVVALTAVLLASGLVLMASRRRKAAAAGSPVE
jgi:plastocyanin